ncbi:hypothetical protein GCM10023221_10460 [Luteimicrobium xylanilyticum]|uniref:DUF1269 domain-containing protein n=1 Tax=Luteimicrobium xylanilyticum TaxID=1133546 RepID=A0A5P9QDC7_9MICO|nr:DUF1269 domain-containing protein [Luteimicrobium xylanilyticum]QFU99478.1 hypothetical protein KDY119_03009 [Luteimicrobium xylanilyticum]
MTDYAAVITFPSNSVTYEVFSKAREASGDYGLQAAAIVERSADGQLKVAEGDDSVIGSATLGGSLIGVLIGVLGGPVGTLLGLAVGATGGALVDATRADQGDEILVSFAQAVPAGSNAIVAETSEADTSVLDGFVTQHGGTIARRPLDDVIAELEANEEAADEAAKAARKALREKKKAERAESRSERVEALKAKFHHDA